MRVWLTCALCAVATPALGQAHRLWAERPPDSGPLAQVPDFRALAQQVRPAVVSIAVEQRVKMSATGRLPGGGEPFDFFHRYFGGEMPREYHNRGLGSGFVIDANGLVLTNYHVVEDAESIEVTVEGPDRSEHKVTAQILGSAPKYDVALLRSAEPLNTNAVFLGNSDTIEIGDWVMAVGNPFGLTHSVSVGIISAKERREIAPSGRQGLYNFLQTDASINPGNSGGPLLNMRGEVIGINSAVNAAGSGIGFAIPINMVKDMLPDLASKGRYARSWLGIRIQPLTAELAGSFGLKRSGGALVAEVIQGSPAATAGLKEGDVVLGFDDKDVRTSSDLPLFASMAGVGKSVAVKIWRDGKETTLSVKLTEFPDEVAAPGVAEPAESGELGMRIADVTPQLAHELGLSASRGVVVREVDPNGLAARAGLRRGDLILSVSSTGAANARTVADTVRRAAPGELLRIKVSRGGAMVFLALRKPVGQ